MKIAEKYFRRFMNALSVVSLSRCTPVDGGEPEKIFKCSHTNAIIWANRKVTLIGKGDLTQSQKTKVKVRLTIRQFYHTLPEDPFENASGNRKSA